MKSIRVLVPLLIVTLLLIGVGCDQVYPSTKTTGGGWFDDQKTCDRITFGFNAQPVEGQKAQGQFQAIDHGTQTRIHGTFDTTLTSIDPSGNIFYGTCSVNGNGSYRFEAIFVDRGEPGAGAGDYVSLFILTSPEPLYYSGFLGGGNIQIH